MHPSPPKALHFGGPAAIRSFGLAKDEDKKMFYTYILECQKGHKISYYTGFCENLQNRFKEHISRETKTTKKFDRLKLIYYEACLNKTDAQKRELQLKTGFGRGYVKRRLYNYLRIMHPSPRLP